jgi:hypothetical protein
MCSISDIYGEALKHVKLNIKIPLNINHNALKTTLNKFIVHYLDAIAHAKEHNIKTSIWYVPIYLEYRQRRTVE